MITSSGRRLSSACLAIVGIAGASRLARPRRLPRLRRAAARAGRRRSIARVRGTCFARTTRAGRRSCSGRGMILGDPISEPFSTWLKSELGQRFPGRPVGMSPRAAA